MFYLSWAIKILLFLTVLTPLIVAPSLHLFPFVFGKMVFYRTVIELAVIFGLVLLFLQFIGLINLTRLISHSVKSFFRSPFFLLILGFFAVAAISTLLAPNSLHAFFGDVERGEGLLGLLHYLAFLVLALIFFEKHDWLIFFGGLVIVGVIVSLYAWLQYFGVSNFIVNIGASSQPGSLTGNPAFLSSFLIILLGGLGILWVNWFNKTYRVIILAVAIFFAATVFVTGIRGALFGLAAGFIIAGLIFLFSKDVSRRIKIFGGSLIILLLIFGGTFWLTRHNDFWQNIPGLKRLANVSLASPSVSTRLIALGVSWEAFKERPIFGWGPENYNIAYNKHYNPAYSYYAEDWFDRAHNKVAEVAVTFGGVGLLFYFGIFTATFWAARKNVFLIGALAAYFVQNLFLFDNITSYIPLFGIWGYLIYEKSSSSQKLISNHGEAESRKNFDSVGRAISAVSFLGALILLVAVGYTAYFHVYIPVRQAKIYAAAVRTKVGEKILAASEEFLYPYNFFQPTLRARLADMIYDNRLLQSLVFRPLALKSIAALEETAEIEKEPRQYVRLVEAYNELAKQDPVYFEKSENFARKALALSPRRQGLFHHLAFALAGQDRFEEAIVFNEQALALEPRAYKSYYQLGLIQALAADASINAGTARSRDFRNRAEENLSQAWEMARANDYQFFSEYDFRNLVTIYVRWKEFRKAADVLERMIVGCVNRRTGESRLCFPRKENYLDLISLYRTLRDADGIILTAEKLKVEDPSLADQLDVVIDLVRKGKWEILDSL